MHAEKTFEHGDQVLCLAGDIDKNKGQGAVGRIEGFARLSSYHGREARVRFGDGLDESGWFWVRDLEPACT